jgi:maltooligosyltrehalose trehalohydrolase
MSSSHRMPFGAECRPDGSIRFCLWAPAANLVDLCLATQCIPMLQSGDGWFELITDEASTGARYQFRINGKLKIPDPASRFQPSDVHGPSEVIDPTGFDWSDNSWCGRPWAEAVTYELHVGTFTPEGTFAAVEEKLNYFADLGVTALELMPVADFPGGRNWGYDGVLPFAPDSSYGRPEDLKRLVQAAHARELMIFLDVVYNHFGPEGNYLRAYAPEFFTDRHKTPWGEAINFDGPDSRTVRDFFIHNALYWLEEYHFDGLRFDAVHAIVDESKPDILTELAEKVRSTVGKDRLIHLMLENDNNAARCLQRGTVSTNQSSVVAGNTAVSCRPDVSAAMRKDLCISFSAQWNDDFHHAAHVLITRETDGYYSDYASNPAWHLGRCLTEGFSYQGEPSAYRDGARRGEPSYQLPLDCFVNFLQNHDQVGNRAFGERILQLTSAEALRAAVSILLLAPSPPLLFMGEEFASDSPFLFFCDFSGDLAKAVTKGRRAEFARFEKFSSPSARANIPDPSTIGTFRRSKVNWAALDHAPHAEWHGFYKKLMALRKTKIVPLILQNDLPDAKFMLFGAGGLFVQWEFGESISLSMLANLSDKPAQHALTPRGTVIYGADLPASELPPWYVAWLHRQ